MLNGYTALGIPVTKVAGRSVRYRGSTVVIRFVQQSPPTYSRAGASGKSGAVNARSTAGLNRAMYMSE